MEKPCQHGPLSLLFQKTKKKKGKLNKGKCTVISPETGDLRKKRAPMPLYNTATHNSFTRHRPASGTNIHTAYSTVHVATSVPVAALHKMTAGLCVICVRMYLCSAMSVVECAGGGGWGARREEGCDSSGSGRGASSTN